MHKAKSTLLALVALPFGMTASADALTRPYLSLEAAEIGIDACRDYAAENNIRVAVAVLDRGGRPVAFMRMNDVFQKQIEIAHLKAETAATTPVSTQRLAELSRSENSALAGIEEVPGLLLVEGGEPILTDDGYSIGGVGVSGARPDQDGACARAAANAIKEALQQ